MYRLYILYKDSRSFTFHGTEVACNTYLDLHFKTGLVISYTKKRVKPKRDMER